MERRRIGPPVREQVVPCEQLAGLRLDLLADQLEARSAAVVWLVQIDHRRPGPLPTLGGMQVVIIPARLERVGVWLELLSRCIALALRRLAVLERSPEQVGDLALDLGDD